MVESSLRGKGRSLAVCLAVSQRPGTANTHLAGLRGVLKEAWRLDCVSTDHYLQAGEPDCRAARVLAHLVAAALASHPERQPDAAGITPEP